MVGEYAGALELAGDPLHPRAARDDELRLGGQRPRRIDGTEEPEVRRARPGGREGGNEGEGDEKAFQEGLSPAA